MLRDPCKLCIVYAACSIRCYKLDAYTNNWKRISEGTKFMVAGFYLAVLVVSVLLGFVKAYF